MAAYGDRVKGYGVAVDHRPEPAEWEIASEKSGVQMSVNRHIRVLCQHLVQGRLVVYRPFESGTHCINHKAGAGWLQLLGK